MSRDRAKANAQVRLCRARKKAGLTPYTVWARDEDLLAVMRMAQFIGEFDSDPEHAEVEALLQRAVDLWLAPPE